MSILPPRLLMLAALHRPEVAKSFACEFKFAGITPSTFDSSTNIWDCVSPDELEKTCRYLSKACLRADALNPDRASIKLGGIASSLVMAEGIAREIQAAYLDLCADASLSSDYADLRVFATVTAELLGISDDIDLSEFPSDLVGRNVPFEHVRDFNAAFQLIAMQWAACTHVMEKSHEVYLSSQERVIALRHIQEQMPALAGSIKPENLAALSGMIDEARELSGGLVQWFYGELIPVMRSYVGLWKSFYDAAGSLIARSETDTHEQADPASQPEESASEQVVPPEPAADDLAAALVADNDHLRDELRELRVSLHKLRCQVGNSPSLVRAEIIPSDSADSVYRVAMREQFSPSDVLAFFAATLPGRVEILDSAWLGAADYSVPCAAADRMLELLGKLLGPYLDALREGSPDAQARQFLGGKCYSAQESETTLNVARLRALREFDLDGVKHLFVRHLRVSNATGAAGMRVYFDVLDREGVQKIVIAYVGPHLEVSGS